MGTFYNKAVCDFYLGQGAGKKLLEDINSIVLTEMYKNMEM